MSIKVDVTDPEIRAKLQANGIRWRLKHADGREKLELTAEQADAAGLTGKTSTAAKVAAELKAKPPVAEAAAVQPHKGRVFGSGAKSKDGKE